MGSVLVNYYRKKSTADTYIPVCWLESQFSQPGL